jgi:hypothetical protein
MIELFLFAIAQPQPTIINQPIAVDFCEDRRDRGDTEGGKTCDI